MKKIYGLSILAFSVALVACSGDGNPSASRFSDDGVNPPSVVNDPADVQKDVKSASKNSKKTSSREDDEDDDDDDDERYGGSDGDSKYTEDYSSYNDPYNDELMRQTFEYYSNLGGETPDIDYNTFFSNSNGY